MMEFKRLLAKNSKTPDSPQARECLPQHLSDVVGATQALVRLVGSQALKSFALDKVFSCDELFTAVTRGAFIHDLGKANHQFQRMVRPGNWPPQALRHEWISTWLLLKSSELHQWLFNGASPPVRYAALFGALGHHLKAEDGATIADRGRSEDLQVTFFGSHPDFNTCLEVSGSRLCLFAPPSIPLIEIDLATRPLGELRKWLPDASNWYKKATPETRRFVSLVKALVISADVAGSALPKQGIDPEAWIEAVLGRFCSERDLHDIATTRLGSNPPRPFQKYVQRSAGRVTFVRAGCGSGKTAAAYLWAARQAPGRKLFFCYPTTGTATEGYRDYIVPSEISADAELLHSRNKVDLEDLLDTHEDDLLERTVRAEALRAWDVPLVICTADRVLGLIQNNRQSLFSFPSISNGAFVFDEIHQYDNRLFGALLRFIEAFQGAPILLMTASLPTLRLTAIKQLLNQQGQELKVISGPISLEKIERYKFEGLKINPPWDIIQQALARGDKILWVTNTVDRAASFAREAQGKGIEPILLYHSRYRYLDRLEKHSQVVTAFAKVPPAPVLAITTQVCEVSLDLSADLLLSDLAPVPALIQRLGRLNRRVTPEDITPARPAIFLESGQSLPYEKEDLAIARNWIQTFTSTSLSQATLASSFEQLSQGAVPSRLKSAWLDGGPFSEPSPLREAGVTISVIRAEDEQMCLDKRGNTISKEVSRYTIPMIFGPVAKEIHDWKRLGAVFLTPTGRIDYSKEWGARWVKSEP